MNREMGGIAETLTLVRVQGCGNHHNLTPPLLRKGEEFLWFEIGKFDACFACFAVFTPITLNSYLNLGKRYFSRKG